MRGQEDKLHPQERRKPSLSQWPCAVAMTPASTTAHSGVTSSPSSQPGLVTTGPETSSQGQELEAALSPQIKSGAGRTAHTLSDLGPVT